MAIPTTVTFTVFTGNGSTTQHSIPFIYYETTEIAAKLYTISTGAQTDYTTFTVTTPDAGGSIGTATCTTAPTSDQIVIFYLNMDLKQSETQTADSSYDGPNITLADDKVQQRAKQVRDNEVDLCLKLKIGDVRAGGVSVTIPEVTGHANKVLAVNATEDGFEWVAN